MDCSREGRSQELLPAIEQLAAALPDIDPVYCVLPPALYYEAARRWPLGFISLSDRRLALLRRAYELPPGAVYVRPDDPDPFVVI